MGIIRSFEPGDRCRYDFDLCACARGWAQVDTAQDAAGFATWSSAIGRTVLTLPNAMSPAPSATPTRHSPPPRVRSIAGTGITVPAPHRSIPASISGQGRRSGRSGWRAFWVLPAAVLGLSSTGTSVLRSLSGCRCNARPAFCVLRDPLQRGGACRNCQNARPKDCVHSRVDDKKTRIDIAD